MRRSLHESTAAADAMPIRLPNTGNSRRPSGSDAPPRRDILMVLFAAAGVAVVRCLEGDDCAQTQPCGTDERVAQPPAHSDERLHLGRLPGQWALFVPSYTHAHNGVVPSIYVSSPLSGRALWASTKARLLSRVPSAIVRLARSEVREYLPVRCCHCSWRRWHRLCHRRTHCVAQWPRRCRIGRHCDQVAPQFQKASTKVTGCRERHYSLGCGTSGAILIAAGSVITIAC